MRASFTAADGRRFAFPVGGVFVQLALVAFWRDRPGLGMVLGTAGGVLLTTGLIMPAHLGPAYRAWMRLASILHRVTSPIVLGVLWFLVITPFALLARGLGRRSLTAPTRGASRWVARQADRRRSNLSRQF